jgi:hypothetical protein
LFLPTPFTPEHNNFSLGGLWTIQEQLALIHLRLFFTFLVMNTAYLFTNERFMYESSRGKR